VQRDPTQRTGRMVPFGKHTVTEALQPCCACVVGLRQIVPDLGSTGCVAALHSGRGMRLGAETLGNS